MSGLLDVYLIRHGESVANADYSHVVGSPDFTPLTELGKRQAIALGNRLKAEGKLFGNVYSSTAERAMHTADIACGHIGFETGKIVRLDELLEIRRGEFSGRLRSEAYDAATRKMMDCNPYHFAPPGGESQRMVEQRMMEWLKQAKLHEGRIAMFGHGYAIKTLLRGIFGIDPGMTYKISLDNTSITRIQLQENGWHILSLNDTMHLSAEGLYGKRPEGKQQLS